LAPALSGRHAALIAALRSPDIDKPEIACRLARYYGCSPADFLGLEAEALVRTVEATLALMQEEAANG